MSSRYSGKSDGKVTLDAAIVAKWRVHRVTRRKEIDAEMSLLDPKQHINMMKLLQEEYLDLVGGSRRTAAELRSWAVNVAIEEMADYG